MTTTSKRRPDVEEFDNYEEFYEAVVKYVEHRGEKSEFDASRHLEEDTELVRICPHCGAPAIVSVLSSPENPSWRCVGQAELAGRHQFKRDNIPKERIQIESTEEEAAS